MGVLGSRIQRFEHQVINLYLSASSDFVPYSDCLGPGVDRGTVRCLIYVDCLPVSKSALCLILCCTSLVEGRIGSSGEARGLGCNCSGNTHRIYTDGFNS